jgi:hypothetical protein
MSAAVIFFNSHARFSRILSLESIGVAFVERTACWNFSKSFHVLNRMTSPFVVKFPVYYLDLTSPLSAFTQKVLRFSGLFARIANLSSKNIPPTRQTFPTSAYDHCLYSTLAAEQRPVNDVVHRIKG